LGLGTAAVMIAISPPVPVTGPPQSATSSTERETQFGVRFVF
jgi:hypothetical protein